MIPDDHEELVWAALTHLKMTPEAFIAALSEPIPDDRDARCWLVRCNPLLQLRYVIVDFEPDWPEACSVDAYRDLVELFRRHETGISKRGTFDCSIYTRRHFLFGDEWDRLRVLARSALEEALLPDWKLPEPWSYAGNASWDEIEDEVFGAIKRGRIRDSFSGWSARIGDDGSHAGDGCCD